MTTKDGKESFASLFLPKEAVDAMLNQQQPEIVFVRERPSRFLMKGEPLPPFGLGWALGGLVLFAVFLYSLKLR